MLLKEFNILKPFGEHLKIKPKFKKSNDKDIFINIISLLDDCYDRSKNLEVFGISVKNYDEAYYTIIETLFFQHYGKLKAEIIFWWLYGRYNQVDDLKPIPQKYRKYMPNYYDEYIETPEQLWDAIKEIKEK